MLRPVDVAMARSLAPGALRPGLALARRDLLVDAADRVYNVKTAFSSWDNCMQTSFCKYAAQSHCLFGHPPMRP